MNLEELNVEVKKLVDIMEILRGPDGCPWDRKQDYFSLAPYILEEAYEVVETLQKKDINLLQEELGDLLLQVVFQAQIGRENGDFDLKDIFATVSEKMLRRHPHVFGKEKLNTVDEVLATWQNIKNKEKNKEEDDKSILDDVSQGQPALNQAYEMQEKAAEVGFDWDQVSDVVAKIEEELVEVKEAVKNDNKIELKEELGDLLFAVVNLTRFYDLNPELALLRTILKFRNRFNHIESRVKDRNLKLGELSLKELDGFWEEAKYLAREEE